MPDINHTIYGRIDASSDVALIIPSVVDAKDLKLRLVVVLQDSDDQIRCRVLTQLAAHIADANFPMIAFRLAGRTCDARGEALFAIELGAQLQAAWGSCHGLPAEWLGRRIA